MAKNPRLKALYAQLSTSQFAFVGRGEHELFVIYAAVKRRFSSLCDDDYLCSENCKHGNPREPEWKHTTRTALIALRKRGLVTKPIQESTYYSELREASAIQ